MLGNLAFQHEWIPWEKKKENGKKKHPKIGYILKIIERQ